MAASGDRAGLYITLMMAFLHAAVYFLPTPDMHNLCRGLGVDLSLSALIFAVADIGEVLASFGERSSAHQREGLKAAASAASEGPPLLRPAVAASLPLFLMSLLHERSPSALPSAAEALTSVMLPLPPCLSPVLHVPSLPRSQCSPTGQTPATATLCCSAPRAEPSAASSRAPPSSFQSRWAGLPCSSGGSSLARVR